MRKIELGCLVAIVALALPGCSPSPPTQEKPQTPTPPPPSLESAKATATQSAAVPEKKDGASLVDGKPGEIPVALKDLKEKLQPTGIPPQTAPTPKVNAPPSQSPDTQIPGAEKLMESATKLANALAAALEKGDVGEAESLCVREADLGKVLSPSYVSIIGGGIPAQNKASIEHLIAGLKGKKWTVEFKPGKLTKTPERGPFLGGLPLLSQSIIRLGSEGVALEAHLDELILLGEDWRVFRLSAP